MPPTNSKNTPEKLNHFVAQVLDILWESKKWFDSSQGTYKTQIDGILKDNTDAKKNTKLALYLINEVDVSYFHKIDPSLKNNKAIALAALAQDSRIYGYLSPQFQLQPQFAKEAIKSLVRERVSFLEVRKFLKESFKDDKMFSTMFLFYTNYLKTADYLFHSDIERQLIEIESKDRDFLDLLMQKKLLEQRGKKILLSTIFVEYFLWEISNISEYSDKASDEKNQLALEIFQKYLEISPKDMTEDRASFLTSVFEGIHIKEDRKIVEEENEKNKVNSEEEDIDEDDEDGLEERLDFCIPQCHYIWTDTGGCDIQLGASVHIHMSKDEMDTISNTALKNYVEAVKLFQDIGLGFAMLHKEQLFRICDVDYLHGEWLSEWKVLKVLNRVAKRIGIPEKIISEGNPETEEKKEVEVGCFQTYGEAVYQFRQIRSTGFINDTPVVKDISKLGSRSVVQQYLIDEEFFSAEGKGFLKTKQW